MARTATRARTPRSKSKARRGIPNYPVRTDGLMEPYTVLEAHASADYTTDGRTREARVTIGTIDDGSEGHPNTMLAFDFTRYDYHPDSANVAGISDFYRHKANIDFEIYADELEPLAHALMEAVRIGKARGTIPAKPSTTAPRPGGV